MFSFCGCSNKQPTETSAEQFTVGMVCIGDDNSAYDRNFYLAANAATEILKSKGINVEWIYQYNKPDGDCVTIANNDLVEAGCKIIFENSYGQEDYALLVAEENPDVHFVSLTNEKSAFDKLENTHNAFVSIYEGRYLAGVAAGMKLNEIGKTKLGYVAAYDFAEVISGYTAFYLGAKSVCTDVTMDVLVVGSWSDSGLEAQAAQALCGMGCAIISQHSDNTTPATTAQEHGCFHTGYNVDMSNVAVDASLISTRIDWTNYFVYAIESVYNGQNFDQDYCGTLANGEVVMTELNEKVAAPGTKEKLEEVKSKLISGELHVFDTNSFTVNGAKLVHCYALDTDGNWEADTEEAVFDGYFHESYFKSAPYFAIHVDGVNLAN